MEPRIKSRPRVWLGFRCAWCSSAKYYHFTHGSLSDKDTDAIIRVEQPSKIHYTILFNPHRLRLAGWG